MKLDYADMGVIITAIIAVTTLAIKYIPTNKKSSCTILESCSKKFDDIDKKVALNNTDVQLLKSTHNNQQQIINELKIDMGKIFEKIDDLKTIIINNMGKK